MLTLTSRELTRWRLRQRRPLVSPSSSLAAESVSAGVPGPLPPPFCLLLAAPACRRHHTNSTDALQQQT